MPRPLSGTYYNSDVDYEALPREVVLERLTPQALLERTKNAVLSSWQEAVPKDYMGQPHTHRGPAKPLLDMATTGGLTKTDDTGSVSVGPYGFQVTNAPAVTDQSKVWTLNVNPQGGSFSKGDFGIGGTFGSNKSGFIRKGPIRIDAGYGVRDPAAMETSPQQEGWATLGVELGTPKEMRQMNVMPELQTQVAVDKAVQPFAIVNDSFPTIKTAREEADEFLKDYAEKNEDWWRP